MEALLGCRISKQNVFGPIAPSCGEKVKGTLQLKQLAGDPCFYVITHFHVCWKRRMY